MKATDEKMCHMLLHACCGPCSLEPVRVLAEQGIHPDIYYANSNIAPREEYQHRLNTIEDWADMEGIRLIEGVYDPSSWMKAVSLVASGPTTDVDERAKRCRACYRMRFEESAHFAQEYGYEALGTTLSVSPYQFTDIIREELERACDIYGIKAAFEDWRPYYSDATHRSREAGMYRQNYCGCIWSKMEADAERAERAAERSVKKAERAQARKVEEIELEKKRAERRAYNEKRAHQRAVLKALRESRKMAMSADMGADMNIHRDTKQGHAV